MPFCFFCQCFNSFIKTGCLFFYFIFQPKHRSNRLCIFCHAFYDTCLHICRKVYNRCNFTERVIGRSQTSADENHFRLTLHHSLQICLFDRSQICNLFIIHIIRKVLQRSRCRTYYFVSNTKIIQDIQCCHIQNSDTFRIIWYFQRNFFSVCIQRLDLDLLRCFLLFLLLCRCIRRTSCCSFCLPACCQTECCHSCQ